MAPGEFVCPVDGCAQSLDRQTLTRHVRRTHKLSQNGAPPPALHTAWLITPHIPSPGLSQTFGRSLASRGSLRKMAPPIGPSASVRCRCRCPRRWPSRSTIPPVASSPCLRCQCRVCGRYPDMACITAPPPPDVPQVSGSLRLLPRPLLPLRPFLSPLTPATIPSPSTLDLLSAPPSRRLTPSALLRQVPGSGHLRT